MEDEDKIVIKYNSGNFAILCSNCRKILKVGYEFTPEEWDAVKDRSKLWARFCDECKNE